jgi:hypothetical protein
MIERERRGNNFIFRSLVYLFLSDKTMDTVDSQILDGGPPQRLIDPPILSMSALKSFFEEIIAKRKTMSGYLSKRGMLPIGASRR